MGADGSYTPTASRMFVRDVGGNVVANLIAGGIIYLLGTAAGVLPTNPKLVGVAVLIVGAATGAGLLWLSPRLRHAAVRRHLTAWGLTALASAIAAAGLLMASVSDDLQGRIISYLLAASGIAWVLLPLILLVMRVYHAYRGAPENNDDRDDPVVVEVRLVADEREQLDMAAAAIGRILTIAWESGPVPRRSGDGVALYLDVELSPDTIAEDGAR